VELVPKSQHLHLKGGTAAKTIPRRCQDGHYRRIWGEKTEDAQLSMYQADRNLREGLVGERSSLGPLSKAVSFKLFYRKYL
jgi:hypothetical protein